MMYSKKIAILFLGMGLSLFSFFRCGTQRTPSAQYESETDRLAAYQQDTSTLFPVSIKNKWGYMNRNGTILIPPQFEVAEDFSAGIAVVAVTRGNMMLYGYIDAKGQWVVEPQYERAYPFYENKAVVQKQSLSGYINSSGTEIIPCHFEEAGSFSEGIAAVKLHGWTGFIDTTGGIIIEPKYTCAVNHPVFDRGMAPVFGADEMTGFINPSGAWVIPPRFQSAGRFKEEKAWAMIKQEDVSAPYGFTIKGGYINRKGEYLIPPEYDFGWDFYEGYATVWKISEDHQQKRWFVIDTTGQKILSDLPYRNVGAYSEGLFPVQNEKMAWGFINIEGEEVIPPQYTGINRFQHGLARMEMGSAFSPKPVYINTKGEIVWQEK